MSESYDPALRTALEEVYGKYLKALAEKDYEGFLATTILLKGNSIRPKEEFLTSAETLLDFYPKLEDLKLITIKQDGVYAGYYCYNDPKEQENVTLIRLFLFKKESDTWKVRGDSYSNSVFKEGWNDQKLQEMLDTDSKFQLSTYDKEQSPLLKYRN